MTFILVLLFKYGCTNIIYAYMGLAGFSIFFVLAGIIAIELLQKWHVHLDFISFAYILFNFAASWAAGVVGWEPLWQMRAGACCGHRGPVGTVFHHRW